MNIQYVSKSFSSFPLSLVVFQIFPEYLTAAVSISASSIPPECVQWSGVSMSHPRTLFVDFPEAVLVCRLVYARTVLNASNGASDVKVSPDVGKNPRCTCLDRNQSEDVLTWSSHTCFPHSEPRRNDCNEWGSVQHDLSYHTAISPITYVVLMYISLRLR